MMSDYYVAANQALRFNNSRVINCSWFGPMRSGELLLQHSVSLFVYSVVFLCNTLFLLCSWPDFQLAGDIFMFSRMSRDSFSTSGHRYCTPAFFRFILVHTFPHKLSQAVGYSWWVGFYTVGPFHFLSDGDPQVNRAQRCLASFSIYRCITTWSVLNLKITWHTQVSTLSIHVIKSYCILEYWPLTVAT